MKPMKKIIILAVVTALSQAASGQLRYGGMQQIGLNFSEAGIDAHLAVVNGVRFKRYFTGLGANVSLGDGNFFRYWTCNFYADGRYYLGENKRFFGKLNAGVNLITEDTRSYYSWQYQDVKKQPGFFGAAGFGYKAKLNSEIYYSFDITYSLTQLRYRLVPNDEMPAVTDPWFFIAPEFLTPQSFDMRRSAIVLQLGLEFN